MGSFCFSVIERDDFQLPHPPRINISLFDKALMRHFLAQTFLALPTLAEYPRFDAATKPQWFSLVGSPKIAQSASEEVSPEVSLNYGFLPVRDVQRITSKRKDQQWADVALEGHDERTLTAHTGVCTHKDVTLKCVAENPAMSLSPVLSRAEMADHENCVGSGTNTPSLAAPSPIIVSVTNTPKLGHSAMAAAAALDVGGGPSMSPMPERTPAAVEIVTTSATPPPRFERQVSRSSAEAVKSKAATSRNSSRSSSPPMSPNLSPAMSPVQSFTTSNLTNTVQRVNSRKGEPQGLLRLESMSRV